MARNPEPPGGATDGDVGSGCWSGLFFIPWCKGTCLQRLHPHAILHVDVCGIDELQQGRGIEVPSGPELHMTHEPASAFQQAPWIGDLSTSKKPHIHVSPEGIDVS